MSLFTSPVGPGMANLTQQRGQNMQLEAARMQTGVQEQQINATKAVQELQMAHEQELQFTQLQAEQQAQQREAQARQEMMAQNERMAQEQFGREKELLAIENQFKQDEEQRAEERAIAFQKMEDERRKALQKEFEERQRARLREAGLTDATGVSTVGRSWERYQQERDRLQADQTTARIARAQLDGVSREAVQSLASDIRRSTEIAEGVVPLAANVGQAYMTTLREAANPVAGTTKTFADQIAPLMLGPVSVSSEATREEIAAAAGAGGPGWSYLPTTPASQVVERPPETMHIAVQQFSTFAGNAGLDPAAAPAVQAFMDAAAKNDERGMREAFEAIVTPELPEMPVLEEALVPDAAAKRAEAAAAREARKNTPEFQQERNRRIGAFAIFHDGVIVPTLEAITNSELSNNQIKLGRAQVPWVASDEPDAPVEGESDIVNFAMGRLRALGGAMPAIQQQSRDALEAMASFRGEMGDSVSEVRGHISAIQRAIENNDVAAAATLADRLEELAFYAPEAHTAIVDLLSNPVDIDGDGVPDDFATKRRDLQRLERSLLGRPEDVEAMRMGWQSDAQKAALDLGLVRFISGEGP